MDIRALLEAKSSSEDEGGATRGRMELHKRRSIAMDCTTKEKRVLKQLKVFFSLFCHVFIYFVELQALVIISLVT